MNAGIWQRILDDGWSVVGRLGHRGEAYWLQGVAWSALVSTACALVGDGQGVFHLCAHVDFCKIIAFIVGLVYCEIGLIFQPLAGGFH